MRPLLIEFCSFQHEAKSNGVELIVSGCLFGPHWQCQSAIFVLRDWQEKSVIRQILATERADIYGKILAVGINVKLLSARERACSQLSLA